MALEAFAGTCKYAYDLGYQKAFAIETNFCNLSSGKEIPKT
jgi:hypothetical protein